MSSVIVNTAEAHNRLSELIDQARAGVEVLIARRGVPVARLTPVGPTAAVDNAALVASLGERKDRRAKRPTTADLDAYLAVERASWDA